MELVHGGDWAGYRARFGHDALDFSANVSPLGLPQGVADAIVAALPTADRYPDPLCRELRTALSRAEQLPEPWILCGNGAADLIYRLVWALKPRRALLPAPTFADEITIIDPVGIETVDGGTVKLRVTAYDGTVTIECPVQTASISIYTPEGICVQTLKPIQGKAEALNLPQGIYIVKAGKQTAKVLVE